MVSKHKVVKMKNKSVADERTPEEYFDEAKAGLLAIAKSYKKNCMRVDNVLRDYASINKDFNCDFEYAISYCKIKNDTYETIIARIKALKFDDMNDIDNDPFIDLIWYIEDDDISLIDAFDQYAVFEAVRPFGEKVETLKMTIKEMQEK